MSGGLGRQASMTQGDDVASPCVSICEMSAHNGLCIGCHRTLDEIAAWSVLDAAAKRAIIAALPARRAWAGDATRTSSGASSRPLPGKSSGGPS